jgi:hypothetical protein
VLISSQKYSFRFEQSATDDTISKEIFMKHNEPILIPAILFLILGGLGLLGHFGFLTAFSTFHKPEQVAAIIRLGHFGFLTVLSSPGRQCSPSVASVFWPGSHAIKTNGGR